MEKYTNELALESSPYLLQHAHNPVDWVSWSDDIFERAKKENKMILISIGYSSCHWCHVMEHESFEDEEVAALMNKFFINVKVDREERPDVDQIYMNAVQLMTQQGGWPLNCFTLADGRPIYGGTYFPKEQWMNILRSLNHAYSNEYDKVLEYADKLQKGVASSEIISVPNEGVVFEESKLKELIQRWTRSFDQVNGGTNRAPKFPLPNNYEFLLDYSILSESENVRSFVCLTLDKIAFGGIYDQVGGGFSRYSVDVLWKVPHFEKMLYDNAQLISLYSKAYRAFGSPLYKRVVYQSIEWLRREMLDSSGAFYAALDADSEGVEGKFYVWSKEELKQIFTDDLEFAFSLYEFNQNGVWEGNYIPLRSKSDKELMNSFNLSESELELKIAQVNEALLSYRKNRVRPGLDDKCLTSWNGMMLKALCEAYSIFDEDEFLILAIKCGNWLNEIQVHSDNRLWRTYKNEESKIDGFLEDYAHVISGFISLYAVTKKDDWLLLANSLMERSINHFYDENSGMFFFTSKESQLIARKMELSDNVIPASNSVMAKNLFLLSKYMNRPDYHEKSRQMLANIYDGMEMYGSGYSNWASLLNFHVFGFYEVVIVGSDSEELAEKFAALNLPNLMIAASNNRSDIPIFHDKEKTQDTLIYVCSEGVCHAPTSNFQEALKVIQH